MVSPTQLCWRYHSLPLSQWHRVSGLHKIEIGLETKFQDKFSAWFSRNFMLSGKAQNFHFILSNIYRPKYKKITITWIRKLSFDDLYEQWLLSEISIECLSQLLLIAKCTLQNNLRVKKGTRSRMLIEKENSSHKQLMSNLICCNSCRKVGSHIVYVLLSKILIISFWKKHAYSAREIHMGQASTNFHSMLLTCLTINLDHAKCTSKLLKLLYNSTVDTDFYIIITCNITFVIWAHNEQIGQG